MNEVRHVLLNVYNTFEIYKRSVLSTIRFSLPHHHSEMYWRERGTHHTRSQTFPVSRPSSSSPFFLRSGFPFFTVAITKSPAPAAGRRLRRPLIPFTAMMYRFLAPVLSAQFMTAPTGRPREMRNLAPDAPFFPAVGRITQLRTFSYRQRVLGATPAALGGDADGFLGLSLPDSPRFDILGHRGEWV